MLPGPVFHAELLTTARRARYYALRLCYGAVLLAVVWENDPTHYSWFHAADPAELTIQQAAALGRTLFVSFAVAQSIAVVLLTPSLTAGVIAEEKQRRTLHDLLASRLSSAEIVVGKLAARLLHVAVLVGVGLPVLSLLSLFGGVAPELVVLTFIATLSVALFLASLSMLVSIYAQQPRDATAMAYMLMLAWLVFPLLVSEGMPAAGWPWTRVYEWVRPLNDLAGSTSPLYALTRPGVWSRGGNLVELCAWMVGLQTAAAAAFLALAVARLRPVARRQGDRGRWAAAAWQRGRWAAAAWQRGRRLFGRPPCGDDPMLWKERYVSRTSLLTKVVGGSAFLMLAGVVGYVCYCLAVPAFQEAMRDGYGSDTGWTARYQFNMFVRVVGGLVYTAWCLGVASAASSSIVHEREADTWTSLVATPLDGAEVVRAKMFGAVWGTRWLGALLLGFMGLGVAAGSVHPLGFLVSVVETAVFITFVTALGMYVSLGSKSSGRALTTTVGVLLLLNGGYLLCCVPLRLGPPFSLVGVTPVLQAAALVRYQELDAVGRARSLVGWCLTCAVGTFAYGTAAVGLAFAAVSRFDQSVDRPRRVGQYAPAGPPFDAKELGDEQRDPDG